jgi:hypothetical protein
MERSNVFSYGMGYESAVKSEQNINNVCYGCSKLRIYIEDITLDLGFPVYESRTFRIIDVIEMNRSGALKISAIFVVSVLCLSTVGFGMMLSSNPSNNTKSTTVAGDIQPPTSTNNNGSNETNSGTSENGDGVSSNCTSET